MSYKFPIQKFLVTCTDVPTTISEVTKQDLEKKLKEVLKFEPNFGQTSWSISGLTNILEERKKQLNLLKLANFAELNTLVTAPNNQIEDIYSRYNRAHQNGFWQRDLGKWTIKDLMVYEGEITKRLNLLVEHGYVPDGSELTITKMDELLARVKNLQVGLPLLKEEVFKFDAKGKKQVLSQQRITSLRKKPKELLQEALQSKIDLSIQSLVGGVLMVLKFPLNRFKVHFSNPENVRKIVRMITIPAIEKLFKEHKMRFFLKLELQIDLLNVETGELQQNVQFQFPKSGVWGFRISSDIDKFRKTENEIIDNLLGRNLDNTKLHFHNLKGVTLKVANRQFGGCKLYKSTFRAKSRCCLNPSGKDDLCFWRCLAIGLYEKTIPTISKKNAAIQRQKAICLRDEYYKKIGREPINIVLLDQIPDISQAFSINVQINTLKKKEDSSL
eukprot:TRINITY_DN4735_c1_g1_i12.p1 TRINITY_DN4735_c1_g1~~TRINITY_DN4735_c1_g1_i12.p1  ORF type:complete len:443 (-),score=116.85 TRINITY_DN4735_c1_g1_i12:553-1881(-)